MLEIAKTIYGVLIDLVEILQGLGELGLFLAKIFYKIGKGIYFIIHLPRPLQIIVVVIVLVLADRFCKYIIKIKIVLAMLLGFWLALHMSIDAVRNFGIMLICIGGLLLAVDFLFYMEKKKKKEKKEKKEKKKKK